MVPVAFARNTIVIVADAPLANGPMLHVTVVATSAHVPWLGVADWNVVLAGTASVTMTFVAAAGPPFDAVMRYVTFVPVPTVVVPCGTFVIARSAFGAAPAVSVNVAELSAVSVSGDVVETVAVLVIEPVVVGRATIVTVGVAPTATVPMLHVTVPAASAHVPCDAFADTNCS